MNVRLFLPAILAAAIGFAVGRMTARQTSDSVPGEISPASEAADIAPRMETSASGAPSAEKAATEPFTAESIKAKLQQIASGAKGGAAEARAWAEFHDQLAASDLATLGPALASTEDESFEGGIRAIYESWAATDPQAAWNSALSFATGSDCNHALHAVLDAVAQKDPMRALTMAQSIANPELREHAAASALEALAEKNPAGALQIALRSAEKGETSALYSVLSKWAGQDPAGAQNAALKIGGQLGQQARSIIVQGMANKDPRAAWDYASQLPPPTGETYYWDPRLDVLDRWAKKNPRQAIEAALSVSDQELRNRAVARAVDQWASSNFNEAFSFAADLKDAGLRGSVLAALAGNRNADPATMLQTLLDQSPAGDNFQMAVSNLMQRWAQSNPREAAAAALQLPSGQDFNYAAGRVAREWAASAGDKSELLEWMRQLPQGQARARTLESVFEVWSLQDPVSAQRALGLLRAEDQEEARAALAKGWSRNQPAEAARWAVSMAGQPGGRSAMQQAVSAWSRSAPGEAAAFAATAPESLRPELTEQIVSQWYTSDPFAAADWLKRQPAGAAKDAGVSAISSGIAEENPEMALAWTRSITDQSSREHQVQNILRRWLSNDAASAETWIRSAQLSEQTKNAVLGGSAWSR